MHPSYAGQQVPGPWMPWMQGSHVLFGALRIAAALSHSEPASPLPSPCPLSSPLGPPGDPPPVTATLQPASPTGTQFPCSGGRVLSALEHARTTEAAQNAAHAA